MIDMLIIISVIVLGILGVVMGIVLGFASKFFAVKHEPKVAEIEEVLPKVNCGACGYIGCHEYAVAVASGKAEPNLCRPGGEKVAEQIGKIIGKEVKAKERLVAQRYCNGGRKEAKIKYKYDGIKTCKAAALVNNGFRECTYSCLGFGDCAAVCPTNAIVMNANDLPEIDKEKCISCEKCVKECPRNVLHMAPEGSLVHVRCSSIDIPRVTTKACSVGCFSCRLCEKACKYDAIHVINNLAIIDYTKCTNCGDCVIACPRKIIIQEKTPVKKEPAGEKKEEAKEDKK